MNITLRFADNFSGIGAIVDAIDDYPFDNPEGGFQLWRPLCHGRVHNGNSTQTWFLLWKTIITVALAFNWNQTDTLIPCSQNPARADNGCNQQVLLGWLLQAALSALLKIPQATYHLMCPLGPNRLANPFWVLHTVFHRSMSNMSNVLYCPTQALTQQLHAHRFNSCMARSHPMA